MRDYFHDTIIAISTPVGKGAIALIRISGDSSLSIAEKVFYNPNLDFSKIKARHLYYGKIIDPVSLSSIDEVLLSYMPSSSSFTGEDTVEINSHGGEFVPYKVLDLILSLGGLRLADAGEFTRRAYLNSRIDLTQAEAINEIISSRNSFSLQSAMSSLGKDFSTIISSFRQGLIDILSMIEVHIDYPDEDLAEPLYADFTSTTDNIVSEIDNLLEDTKQGYVLKEGIRLVIVGKTNVGKSSLFNHLVRQEKAIVSSVHGTTRDYLEANINLRDLPVNLIDTAGLRETSDEIELIGKRLTYERMQETDYILWLLDASRAWDEDDASILSFLRDKSIDSSRVIALINKIDLDTVLNYSLLSTSVRELFKVSIFKGLGLSEFEDALVNIVLGGKDISFNSSLITCNLRQESLLIRARKSLLGFKSLLESSSEYEFLSLELREALDHLGEITGDFVSSAEVIDNIFSNFCVGK